MEVRQQHEAGHAIYSSGPGHSGVPPQECDYVMELKIPRFVVEQVYPNLAFNSSAISTAMKIGDSTVRYDVAKVGSNRRHACDVDSGGVDGADDARNCRKPSSSAGKAWIRSPSANL